MTKINWMDILERAAWTFIEAFLIALPVTFNSGMDDAAMKSAVLSAATAGLSALKTFAIELIRMYRASKEAETPETVE